MSNLDYKLLFLFAFVYTSTSVFAFASGGVESEATQFEAAFQGKCGHGSPCDQLCYELHDGMYECDCTEGFELHKNGYSCLELNTTAPSRLENEIDNEPDILYQKDASFSAELEISLDDGTGDVTKEFPPPPPDGDIKATTEPTITFGTTTQGPSLDQKVPRKSLEPRTTTSLGIEPLTCMLECGPGGACIEDSNLGGDPRCQCPLGRGGLYCNEEVDVRSPRFTGHGWLAFPALRAAYKHVQVHIEIRPEAYDGIFFLTGERDDMAGDFMALLIHQGFIEFRFDCGSGVGVVRSEETVLLNQWNKITLYRHRWDAWIQLNGGKRVQGRSKGLFSRITFREPLFIGGPGNTTGLGDKLPLSGGLRGCVRHLEVNEQDYKFTATPEGDAVKGFDIQECTADRCSRAPCQHGGKCLTSPGDAVCLCPLGFSGDLCETRLDLQVPAFNGSSYLRYRGLGESTLSWLDVEVILKPSQGDGVIMFNGQHPDGSGDFIALYLSSGYAGFAFDLGSGTAVVRSEFPLPLNEWHSIRVSRTGRLATLQVDMLPATDVLSPGAFTHLSLPQGLHLGGMHNIDILPHVIKDKGSFVGCIQKVVINERQLGILAEALGGSNVNNCPHPCITKPCGPVSRCVPDLEYFTCECNVQAGEKCYVERPLLTREVMMPKPVHLQSSTGSRFTGTDSYLHYSDVDTMRRIISYQVDINLRFRTTSTVGLILWSGRHPMRPDDDFLALGIEDGYLQLRYNLGSGEVTITYERSKINDGLWHRVHAVRNSQEGSLEVDDGEATSQRSPGKLRQLNTDTGLYIGGMPYIFRDTRRRYRSGMIGCISEIVLGGDVHLSLDPTEDTARNVNCVDYTLRKWYAVREPRDQVYPHPIGWRMELLSQSSKIMVRLGTTSENFNQRPNMDCSVQCYQSHKSK